VPDVGIEDAADCDRLNRLHGSLHLAPIAAAAASERCWLTECCVHLSLLNRASALAARAVAIESMRRLQTAVDIGLNANCVAVARRGKPSRRPAFVSALLSEGRVHAR